MAGTWKKDPTSWRTAPRPKGWKSEIIPAIKQRDHNRCTWVVGVEGGGSWRMWADVRRCPKRGVDVDHMGAPDDHRPEMLRLLCEEHHDHKTAIDANRARWSAPPPRNRPTQRHPGLIITQSQRTRRVTGGG